MRISLTEEQELLRDTVSRLASALATTNPGAISTGEDLDAQWMRVVELGVPALRSPEVCGLETSGVETALAVEAMARQLCASPTLGQGVLTPELLEAANADKELEQIVEGSLRMAPVLTTNLTGFGLASGSGIAFDAAGATHVLLLVESEGGRRLAQSPLDPADVEAETPSGLDLTRSLRRVGDEVVASATEVGDPISPPRWMAAEAMALTAVAADLVGVMAGALDDAVRHADERVQFDVKIGSFQAVQHLLADCLVRVEGARSCLWHAAWAVDHLPSPEALLAARTAKAYAAAAGREVVEAAMQVLGGMAITWEHLAHLRLRRTLLDRRLFGDEDDQYQAIAAARLADQELV